MGQVTEDRTDSALEGAALAAPAVDTTSVAHQGLTIYDLLLLGMVSTWAVNPAAIKWALGYMDPLVFNALRFTLATLALVAVMITRRETFKWHKGDGPMLLLLGLLGHGIYQTVFILGVDNTLAGNVALILSISPAFIAIFGALFGYEKVQAYTWAGVCLTLTGVGLVVLGSGAKLEFGKRLLGDLMTVGVTMLWALYTVLSQRLLKRYSSVKLNALTMPIGAVMLLVVASTSVEKMAPRWGGVPSGVWLVLALSGLFAVAASYIIWYRGVQKLGATRTAVYSNLVPVLAAFVSFFILKEPLGWQFWLGMLLVIAGVSLARFGGRLIRRQSTDRRAAQKDYRT